ncbi:MAG: sulfite exporter TauE/SafE family protein [Pseudomonadota bacterium]
MNTELSILFFTAASIGFIHTLLGPDHYIPFIAMAKAREWSLLKTSIITILCGLGHVMSSVVIGLIGIIFGLSIMKIGILEEFRGNLAAWALIGFGLVYFIWGMRRAYKGKPHRHIHMHEDMTVHSHDPKKTNITPWVLFTIFVLGPCEPLIPILMYPAAKMNVMGLIWTTAIFGIVTISTMLGIVILSSWGLSFARIGKLENYTHALAGATICLSGLAVQFLGL